MTIHHRREAIRRRHRRGGAGVPVALLLAGLLCPVPPGPLAASAVDQAMALAGAGSTEGAMALLETVIAGEPDNIVARNNLAVLYAAEGDLTRARALLIEAMNSDPRYALVYRNLTDIYDRFAARAYERALYGEAGPANAPLALVPIEPGATVAAAPQPPAGLAETPVAGVPVAAAAPPAPPPAQVPAPEPAQVPAPPPAQVPAPEPAQGDDVVRRAVLDVVERWAAAWSDQDVDAYLRLYGPDFAVPGGGSRAEWEAQRRVRLRRPAFIEVRVDDPQVDVPDPDRAEVRFRQTYRNDAFTSTVIKVLTLSRAEAGWEIVGEAVRR